MKEVFDAHIHYLFDIPIDKTIDIFKREFCETNTVGGCFLSIPHEVEGGEVWYDEMQNLKGLYLKQVFGNNFYAFAGLVHPIDYQNTEAVADSFLEQVKEYTSVGFDGMKMLEGYPSLLKARKIPLDSPIYDKYYAFMEENGYPITMHVANPSENWDISRASQDAIEAGRVYDSSYPTKDEITAQIFGVMKKFPKLKLALAHMGFFSGEKENAERFLGDYENTVLDLTPGGEQLIAMGKNWDVWGEFFQKYRDRIIYGTDFYAFPDEDEENWRVSFTRRPNFVRQFFETDTEHDYLGDKFTGVKIGDDLLDLMYKANSKKNLGERSKVSREYILEEAKRLQCVSDKRSKFADSDLKYILENL